MHRYKHIGQAMTETLITSSFILVPLFLLIPMLGKYIDIKHSTIQAARYEAWEYSVWYRNNSERPDGFFNYSGKTNLASTQPIKSATQLQTESRRRFYSDPRLALSNTDKTGGWQFEDRNLHWTDHQNTPIWLPNNAPSSLPQSNEDTPTQGIIGGVGDIVAKVLDTIFSAVAGIMKLSGGTVGFTSMNLDGYAKSNIQTAVTVPEGIIDVSTLRGTETTQANLPSFQLVFSGRSSVLTDGWNAGGRRHVINQAGGLTPSKILADLMNSPPIPALKLIQNGLGLIAPELRPCDPWPAWHPFDRDRDGALWFGYQDVDAIPPDRLVDTATGDTVGSYVCVDGMCGFDPPHPYPNPEQKDECD